MSENKLSEELRRCLEDDGCGDCQYHKPETKLICKGLLQKAHERIKEFEEMEENYFLLKLPCKTGDKVYHFCKEFGKILEYDVDFINISDGITTISCSLYSQGIDDTGECLDEIEVDITDFDFNTSTPYSFVSIKREEVEQKLKEMEDRKNGKVD